MEGLQNIIESNGVTLSQKLKNYLRIFTYPPKGYEFGISQDGWVLIEESDILIVFWDSNNFIGLLKTLEIPHFTLKSIIDNKMQEYKINESYFDQVFPIKGMTITAFNMESDYWSNLSIEFLLTANILVEDLKIVFKSKISEKWVGQKLKHKMKKYIYLTSNGA
ncbi:hypothetical protein RCC89_09980 [Cytophagaceae bacterium ABcell3]|nr:hypothetical protein RCC89_09980 [Cytophagaceae bacterium ABcell3]